LRNDERRRLTRSMRCLRAQESYILDQRTLTGVPVGVSEAREPLAEPGRTLAGWSAPASSSAYTGRPSRVTASPVSGERAIERFDSAFQGGLDLAASVFSPNAPD
jgi:hypothetical protein